MTKIVINDCHGGFSITEAAARKMAEWGSPVAAHEVDEYDRKRRGDLTDEERQYPVLQSYWYGYLYGDREAGIPDLARDDPLLVRVVEEMGKGANGSCASLAVVEIPDGVEWQVEEYDGAEWVAEKHRVWNA